MMKIRDILKLGNPVDLGFLKIESLPVWDYKVQEGKLKLIWEPEKGSQNYEKVTVQEVYEYLLSEIPEGDGLENLEILPETGGESFRAIEQEVAYLNFRLK